MADLLISVCHNTYSSDVLFLAFRPVMEKIKDDPELIEAFNLVVMATDGVHQRNPLKRIGF